MDKSKVTEVEIGSEYLIYKNIEQTTFSDNFRLVSSNLNYQPEPKDVMIAFFLSFPPTFKVLLTTREFLAKLVKLKTAPETEKELRVERLYQFKGDIGERVAIFEVLDKTEKELLTGQTDSHLDFKLSFITFQSDQKVTIELATTVVIHNTIGKIYFAIVKPIHKFYLKKIVRRMEFNLINKSW